MKTLLQKFALWLLRVSSGNHNARRYALQEFRVAGWLDERGRYCDEMQQLRCENTLLMLDVFSVVGHSGCSAAYARGIVDKLLQFEPLTPLTGEEGEWMEVDDGLWQNRRASRVFRQRTKWFNGWEYYDIDGKIFCEKITDEKGKVSKIWYSSSDSRTPVEFPYTPVTEYVENP